MRYMSIVTSSQPPANPTPALLEAMHLVVTKPPYSALKLFVCFAADRYFEQ